MCTHFWRRCCGLYASFMSCVWKKTWLGQNAMHWSSQVRCCVYTVRAYRADRGIFRVKTAFGLDFAELGLLCRILLDEIELPDARRRWSRCLCSYCIINPRRTKLYERYRKREAKFSHTPIQRAPTDFLRYSWHAPEIPTCYLWSSERHARWWPTT